MSDKSRMRGISEMSKTVNDGQNGGAKSSVGKFEPGGEMGPVADRNDYEQRLNNLPPEQKDLTQENARLADLCQYFSQQRMGVPAEILDRIGGLSKLETAVRIRALKEINQGLMEYLNRVGKGSQIRQ